MWAAQRRPQRGGYPNSDHSVSSKPASPLFVSASLQCLATSSPVATLIVVGACWSKRFLVIHKMNVINQKNCFDWSEICSKTKQPRNAKMNQNVKRRLVVLEVVLWMDGQTFSGSTTVNDTIQ